MQSCVLLTPPVPRFSFARPEKDIYIENLLVRIHLIIEMIWWTGLAPLEISVPFPGSLTSIFQVCPTKLRVQSTVLAR